MLFGFKFSILLNTLHTYLSNSMVIAMQNMLRRFVLFSWDRAPCIAENRLHTAWSAQCRMFWGEWCLNSAQFWCSTYIILLNLRNKWVHCTKQCGWGTWPRIPGVSNAGIQCDTMYGDCTSAVQCGQHSGGWSIHSQIPQPTCYWNSCELVNNTMQ